MSGQIMISQKKIVSVLASQAYQYMTGAVSKTATAPLETVRMQMMTGKKVTLDLMYPWSSVSIANAGKLFGS